MQTIKIRYKDSGIEDWIYKDRFNPEYHEFITENNEESIEEVEKPRRIRRKTKDETEESAEQSAGETV